MSLRLGGDGAITGCSSLSEPALTLSGLTVNNDSGNTGATITAAGNAFLVLDSSVGGTAGNQISFIDFKNNGTNQANLAVNEGVTGKPLEINSSTNNNVTIATGGGNVGIGTTSPSMLLDVRGTSNPQIKVSATNTGSNSAGLYIENQGQRNWQIWADRSSDQLRIGHNSRASTVVSITDTRIGVGTSNPGQKFVVSEGGAQGLEFNPFTSDRFVLAGYNRSTSQYIQLEYEGTNHLFKSGTSEKMRLTSDGKLGIGLTNPEAGLEVRGADQTSFSAITDSGALTGFVKVLGMGSTPGAGGGVLFGAEQSYNAGSAGFAAIKGQLTDGGGNSRGDLAFFTRGSTSDTELKQRMRIDHAGAVTITGTNNSTRMLVDSSGRVCINRTTSQSGGQLSIDYTNGITAGLAIKDTLTTGTGVILHVVNGAGSIIGGISQNQSSTSFNTSSDYRLKENIVDLDGAIDRVKQLLPKRFNFISDADITVDGFLAHEAQSVVPEAVTGTHDEVDDEGNAVMQGIDQSKLVPLLTAALKEAIAEIETLKTKVAALEASA